MTVPMYDDLSANYDRFVDWTARLKVELPFIERALEVAGARRVLDAACGTGMHALALAKRGYEMAGADLSAAMIERARANAARNGLQVRFVVAGFGEFHSRAGVEFDAVLCLGNSLPHVLSADELHAALVDFAGCLRPCGLLLVQNRNFDAVVTQRQRWMEPQAYREGDAEWIFLRFYDFEVDGTLAFNVLTLRRSGGSPWRQHGTTTRLRPWTRHELLTALTAAGFQQPAIWGDMQGRPFDQESSPNLVVSARTG